MRRIGFDELKRRFLTVLVVAGALLSVMPPVKEVLRHVAERAGVGVFTIGVTLIAAALMPCGVQELRASHVTRPLCRARSLEDVSNQQFTELQSDSLLDKGPRVEAANACDGPEKTFRKHGGL